MKRGQRKKRQVPRQTKPTGMLSVRKPRADTIEHNFPLFPARKRAYLTYHTHPQLFCGAGGVAGTHVFAANGLYDPDVTSTGHQPMGFDQMMTFYYHYTVLKAKITVWVKDNSTTLAGWCAVSRNGSSTATTAIDDLIEGGNIEYHPVNRGFEWQSNVKMVMDMDVARYEGIDDLLDDNDYRGSSSANPNDIAYFHVSVWNPYDATSYSFDLDVLIEFEAIFTEPRKPTSSLDEVKMPEVKPKGPVLRGGGYK